MERTESRLRTYLPSEVRGSELSCRFVLNRSPVLGRIGDFDFLFTYLFYIVSRELLMKVRRTGYIEGPEVHNRAR